jgi:ABC-type molybdate transport system substrate-binding protein
MTAPATLGDFVTVFAAGSLRAAMADLAQAFADTGAGQVDVTLGPSGLLGQRIANGTPVDLFAAADLRQPQTLVDAGFARRVVAFAGNRLCLLSRPGVLQEGDDLLGQLLSPTLTLGTSTPGADPCGDYAWTLFRRAEDIRPGSFAALASKARQLSGGADSPVPPVGRDTYAWLLTDGRADVLLTYRTNACLAKEDAPELEVVALPDVLAVSAVYGMALLRHDKAAARAFADFLLAAEGEQRLRAHGFTPTGDLRGDVTASRSPA